LKTGGEKDNMLKIHKIIKIYRRQRKKYSLFFLIKARVPNKTSSKFKPNTASRFSLNIKENKC